MNSAAPTRTGSRFPRDGGFTLVELLVVIAIIGILLAFLFPALTAARCRAKNADATATLTGLTQALSAYEMDHGARPTGPGGAALVDDTRAFVAALDTRGPRGDAYYAFQEDRLVGGEYMSIHEKPFRYTCPGGTTVGPDGRAHRRLAYYLWTYGCPDDGPEAEYRINNGF